MIKKVVKERNKNIIPVGECNIKNIFAFDPFNKKFFKLERLPSDLYGFKSIVYDSRFSIHEFLQEDPYVSIETAIECQLEVFQIDNIDDLISFFKGLKT